MFSIDRARKSDSSWRADEGMPQRRSTLRKAPQSTPARALKETNQNGLPHCSSFLPPLRSLQRCKGVPLDHSVLPRGDASRPEKPAGEEDEPRFVVLGAEGGGIDDAAPALLLLASPRTTAAILFLFRALFRERGADGAPLRERRGCFRSAERS